MAASGERRFRLEVLGDRELSARLLALEKRVERKYVGEELRRAFKITHAAVLAAVPVASGTLRRTIRLRAGKGKGARFGKLFRIFTGNAAELGIEPSRSPGQRGGRGRGYYPMAVEAGYTLHGRTYGPRSYLRGPLRATEPAVLAAIRSGLWRRITGELTSTAGA